jgi:hypothetical protein
MALLDNILSYWNLDDNGSGGVSLVDSTGNGNTLAASGSLVVGDGKIEDAILFDGSSNSVVTSSGFSGSGDFSISFWVKPNSFSGYRGLISRVSELNIYINFDGSLSVNNASSPSSIESVGSLSLGGWSYVAVIKSGGTTSLYINGSFIASTTQGISPSGGFFIGSFGGFQWFLDGGIDEVGIWNRALSPSEITSLYNGGAGLSYPFEALYFNAAVDGSFGTLGNYWEDSSFTIPATALPTASDFVFILANATSGTLTGDAIRIVDSSIGSSASIVGNVTLTGNSTNAGTITGNVVVEYPSQNPLGGTISGTITYSYPNGNGPWGSIYYINGEATTLDLNGNGVWEGVTYVNGVPQYDGLFFTNSTGNGNFFTLGNWNFLPDGTGGIPDGIPWTADGNGGFWYSDLNLLSGDGVNGISAFGSIGGSGITGTCSINNFFNYSGIYGGTFSGDNFYNYGTIYGGTFSGNDFVNFGGLLGGIFISPAVTISTFGNMTLLSMNSGPIFSYPTPAPSGGSGGIDIARLIGLPPFINL